MNTLLLIFFAIPLAVIIISIALQKILKCPALVASIIFAIFLIVTFIISNINFLVATIIYTIIAYIVAILTCLISRFTNTTQLLSVNSRCGNNENGNLLTISSNACNGSQNDLLTINANNTSNTSNNANCNCTNQCGCNRNTIAVRANVIPNNNCGSFTGCYRRR